MLYLTLHFGARHSILRHSTTNVLLVYRERSEGGVCAQNLVTLAVKTLSASLWFQFSVKFAWAYIR